MLKEIIKNLFHKSNIDYNYYHLFGNNKLNLDFSQNNFTINYVVYVIDSDFSVFETFFINNKQEKFTDVFFERIKFSSLEKQKLFSFIFHELFWLRFNSIDFLEDDYDGFIKFLQKNSLDVNRIFLENCNLSEDFFEKLSKIRGFSNLTFLNFDNNKLGDNGAKSMIDFLQKNNINLEYLSLVNCDLQNFSILENYINNSNLRILDISGNKFKDCENILKIFNCNNIKEIFLKNILFEDFLLKKIYEIFLQKDIKLDFVRLSLSCDQFHFKEKFEKLGQDKGIYFDIDFLKKEKIFTTVYFKVYKDEKKGIENEYFYEISEKNFEKDFGKIIQTKENFLKNGINLFLFDFHDYKKIEFLLSKYSFNYIYIENYFISDDDFVRFLSILQKNYQKKYKINLVSIEITYSQLDYLIENFPENIYYIELNLNKIQKNREKYIMKMLKNPAFIFENMELYRKIFK